jgi:hypothetical protein
MSLYPIYIDSSVAGAQLSIGTTNTSTIIIGAPSTTVKNTSTVINGIRLDSNKTNNNLILTFENSAITPMNGTDNTVISGGLASNTGSHNTAIGSGALLSNTAGFNNTAVGKNTLRQNLIGEYNTAIGFGALQHSTTNANTAIGNGALSGSGYTGNTNTAVGVNTLIALTSGTANTVIGGYADGSSTTGSNNTCIGWTALSSGTNGTAASNSTAIGHNATTNGFSSSTALGAGSACTAANQIMIGTTSQTTQIGNTQISNSGNGGTIFVSTKSANNNTVYIEDKIETANNTWSSNSTTSSSYYGRSLKLLGASINYNKTNNNYVNASAFGSDIVIRAGGSFSTENNGANPQRLLGGNVYIDAGFAACLGGGGSNVIAAPGSIYLRTGPPPSGTTYYNETSNPNLLMTLSNSGIRTTVPMTIYEETGTGTITGTGDTMTATSGSLIIKHGNLGGGSSIIFPSANNNSDYGYIRYRDDVNNGTAGTSLAEQGRLEIGAENDFGAAGGPIIDCLVLNKKGGTVGIGRSDPQYTLDISGTARVTGTLYANGVTIFNGDGPANNNGSWLRYDSQGNGTLWTCGCTSEGIFGSNQGYAIVCNAGGTTAVSGGVYLANSTSSTWTAVSDKKYKKNINPVENCLDNILKLNPVYYNYINSDASLQNIGFIAQDVQSIFPLLVNESPITHDGEKLLGLTMGDLIPYLVKGIQEQNNIINLQKDKITTLESKVDILQKQMADILQRLN